MSIVIFLIDLILNIFAMLGILTFALWIFPHILKRSPKLKKKNKGLIRDLNLINIWIRKFWRGIYSGFIITLKLIFSPFVGINIKPIIYYLNSPLGYGYASWVSYFIAGITFWYLMKENYD